MWKLCLSSSPWLQSLLSRSCSCAWTYTSLIAILAYWVDLLSWCCTCLITVDLPITGWLWLLPLGSFAHLWWDSHSGTVPFAAEDTASCPLLSPWLPAVCPSWSSPLVPLDVTGNHTKGARIPCFSSLGHTSPPTEPLSPIFIWYLVWMWIAFWDEISKLWKSYKILP